ncbi:hybrid sensory histidine kinase BarA [Cesiribacter andamanensis AMV16]|uniref:Hybrid sensory histidine kinase BarA n=2 Tax=Cesiribacter TaxID=1133570 RepID=M7N8C6_9BACT|nr:hybrid sensory histidine kinase BarA [Cesiribacter andamanensis AMV16]
MNMPGMSGLQLLGQIRQLEGENQQIPVIAVTANAMKADLDRYVAEGMTACLLKPFKEEELLQLMGSVWEADTDQESAAPSPEKAPLRSPLPPQREAMPLKGPKAAPALNGYSLQVYEQYAAGDPAALRLMLETFLSSGRQHVQLLEQYLQQQNWQELRELAHKMYPSFKQLKAEKAALLLRRLETEASATAPCSDWIAALQQEIVLVTAFVAEALKEAEPSTN